MLFGPFLQNRKLCWGQTAIQHAHRVNLNSYRCLLTGSPPSHVKMRWRMFGSTIVSRVHYNGHSVKLRYRRQTIGVRTCMPK